MTVCSACRLEITAEAEAQDKLFRASTGEIISMTRHDACAPADGKSLRRIDRSDLKAYLSPAMTRKNGLIARQKGRTKRASAPDRMGFLGNATKVKAS
jgi:hypothetical protein